MTPDKLQERAKAFRERWFPPQYRGSSFADNLLAELDWAEKNPPSNFEEFAKVGWHNALAHVHSLLEEPKGEK